MNLHLHEAIILISLDDEKGNITSASGYTEYAFAAALVMDLILAERVVIEEGRLKLQTNAITDSRALNEVISKLQKKKKPPRVSHWLHTLVEQSKLRKLTIEKLIRNNILQRRQKKILWIFSANRYPAINTAPEEEMRQRLKSLMLDEKSIPDKKERMLLNILLQCDLYTDIISDKQARKRAKARLKVLTEEGVMQQQLGSAIQEMQLLVMVATGVV